MSTDFSRRVQRNWPLALVVLAVAVARVVLQLADVGPSVSRLLGGVLFAGSLALLVRTRAWKRSR